MPSSQPADASAKVWSAAKRRRRLFIVLTVLGSLALSLMGIEVALRVYVAVRGWTTNCYAAHLSLYRPHPQLGVELAPNFRLKSQVFDISTNSLGLRGPEISTVKPQGTVRIAILGGSSAYGYLVSDGEEAARILEGYLRDEGYRVEVMNTGVPGYNLFQSLVRFQEIVARLEPDIVVLYAGFNDIAYLTSDEASRERWIYRPAAPAWERWLGKSVTYGLLAYRLGSPSRQFVAVPAHQMTEAGRKQIRSNLEALASEVEKTGARLVVCSQATAAHPEVGPELKARLGTPDDQFQRAVETMAWIRGELRDFARISGADFIDVASEMPPRPEYLADLIHLTKLGEVELAKILAERLLPLVEQSN
jgi:lysophospholipase L1-like esterase